MDSENNQNIENKAENKTEKIAWDSLSEEEKKLWETEDITLTEKDIEEAGRIIVEPDRVVNYTGFIRPYNPLVRPKVRYKNFIIAIIIYALGLTGTIILSNIYLSPYEIWGGVAFSALYFLIIGKKAVIWAVHFYQANASDNTRLRCRFEPSCSEYMIKSVTKYGFIKGTCKGIGRVCRCHSPNGGIDYP